MTSITDSIMRVEYTFHELCLSEAAVPTSLLYKSDLLFCEAEFSL